MNIKPRSFNEGDLVYGVHTVTSLGKVVMFGSGIYAIGDHGETNYRQHWKVKCSDFLRFSPCIDMGSSGIVWADEAIIISPEDAETLIRLGEIVTYIPAREMRYIS